MKKRILSFLLCFLFLAPLLPTVTQAAHYEYPVVETIADTFIRNGAGYSDVNYIKMNFLVVHDVDNHAHNDRISFVEFDVSDYAYHIEHATRITFQISTGWETADNSFALIPLPSGLKELDLSTLTYDSALLVSSDGQSLITYGDDLIDSGEAQISHISYLTTNEFDITQYCKEQTDGKLMLMLKGNPGGFTLLSMEDGGVNHRPRIIIEGEFTDTQNALYDIAENIKRTYDGKNITSDITLPTQIDGYDVTWHSANGDFLASDGSVVRRPAYNEATAHCKLSYTVSAPLVEGATEEREITINILNEAAEPSEISKNSESVSYSFPTFTSPLGERTIINIPLSGYDTGTAFSLYHNSQKLCDYTYDGIKTELIMDVTSCASSISTEPFVIRGSGFDSMNPAPATISGVSEEAANEIFELYNYDLGDLANVTSDLSLPIIIGESTVSWTSSNREVLANTGRVERNYSTDKASHLTATITGADYSYEMGFNAKIIRANTSVPNGKYRELKDPMYMSDEELFGKWNDVDLVWTIPPVFRYDDYPELFAVESCAKAGDYKNAKHELRAYYNSKPEDAIYKYTPGDYNIYSEAMLDYVCGFYELEEIQAQTYIGTEFAWHSVDLTHKDRANTSTYGLIDSDMDGSTVEIYSKENDPELAAYLSVTADDGRTYKFPVVHDTYISAGDNADTNYGSETLLYCREESTEPDFPICSETKRPYFRFTLPKVFDKPRSVTLNFYARTTGSTPKKVYVTRNSTLANFEEDDLTWHQNKGNYTETEIFNYKKTGWIFNSYVDMVDTRWQVGQTFMGWFSRFNQVSWLMGSYLNTGNEDYAYSALEFAWEQYTQQPHPVYSQALDSGWRMEHMIRLIYTAINSEHMTDDTFTWLIKWMYSHYDQYIGQDTWSAAANQVNAVLANLARVCSFFPEFVPEDEWQTTKDILKDFYSGESQQIFNADGSYVESCSNYMSGVIPEIAGVVRTVESRDGKDHPDYQYFADCLLDLVTYYSGIAFAHGQTIPYGDGGRNSVVAIVKQYNDEFFQRDDLAYIGSKGLEGTEPEYTSQIYPEKAVAMMRSGWDNDAICAFIDNVNGGSHSNRDDLAVDVTAFGTPLLVDAGVGSYSPAVDFTSIQPNTNVHNTIEIDNQNQEIYNIYYPTKQPLTLVGNKGFDLTRAENTLAYPGFEMNRNVLLLKNKFVIVSDSIINQTDSDTHTYNLYWHPDYNTNLSYDSFTGAVKTNNQGAPNVKIFVPGETPDIHYRWMQASRGYGIVQSKSVRYTAETSEPVKTFDTVIYPQNADIDDDIRVSKLDIGTTGDVATSLKIDINRNVGAYYLSNEDVPTRRTFDTYVFDGEMAYVEKDAAGNVCFVAFAGANQIKDSAKPIVYCQEELSDFSVNFGSDTVQLFCSTLLPGEVMIASDKAYANVTLNGEKVAFTYENGYIKTTGAPYVENSGTIRPGSPSSPDRGSIGGSPSGPITPVVPVTPQHVFEDCKDHWANEYITSLYNDGIVSGKTDTHFKPDDPITRAEFAKLLACVLGLEFPDEAQSIFGDVSPDAWYAPYISAVYEAGIISGYEDSTFAPDKVVTRQEMAKMLSLSAGYADAHTTASPKAFKDENLIDPWAKEYVSYASTLGIFGGDENGFFNPHSSATRAESATVIFRFLTIINAKGDETK